MSNSDNNIIKTLRSRQIFKHDFSRENVVVSHETESDKDTRNEEKVETCVFCGASFKSVKGLRIHQNHAHPEEYHKERAGKSYSKCVWPEEESTMLARTEIELKSKRIRNINVEAQKIFPHRSLNAIRSHRRQPSYRSILQKCQDRIEAGGSGYQSGDTSNHVVGNTLDPSRVDGLWTDIANAEWMLNSLEKKRINLALHRYLPNVPVETIRKIRNKPGYRKFLNNFIIQKTTSSVKPTKYAVDPTLVAFPVDTIVDSEIKLKQFILSNYKYLKMPCEELSEVLSQVDDVDSKRRLIDKEYMRWMESCETDRERTGAGSLGRQAPNVIPTSGVRSDHSKTGNQVRQFLTTKIRPSKKESKRNGRKKQRKKVQRLLRKNLSSGARSILNEEYDKESKPMPHAKLLQFWEPVFSKKSIRDDRPVVSVCGLCCDLEAPISCEEVKTALRGLKDGAPGLDGMKKKHLDGIKPIDYAVHMSLWLLTGLPPSLFKIGVVSFIPKVKGTTEPSEFRPITVSPLMSRLFHRVLNKRMSLFWPLSTRQKAFQSGDGLADNIWLVKSLITKSRQERKKINMTFVDVSKAFDSVSHESIVRAASRLGAPPLLTRYLSELYRNCQVHIRMGKELSRAIQVGRGVRQGDPMSPMLFNAVIDMVVSDIDRSIGVTAENESAEKCNYIAFADDLLLLSSTDIGMKVMLQQLEISMAKVGLTMNPAKCASMRTEVITRKRQWIVNPEPYLKLQDKDIKALSVVDTYKYLGVQIGPRMQFASLADRIQKGLHSISRAPLVPCQRVYILRTHLLPSLVHFLTFEAINLKSLNSADVAIRKSVRKWLRLPKDTPNAFLHAPIKMGGMGILQLRCWIPEIRIRRMSKVLQQAKASNDSFMMEALGGSTSVASEVKRFGRPKQKDEPCVPRGLSTARRLYQTVDGYGLMRFPEAVVPNEWLVDGISRISATQYVNCVKVRSATLFNRLRASRRTPLSNTACEAGCGEMESLAHIVQKCPSTDGPRHARHDLIVKMLEMALTKMGYSATREPRIPTVKGTKIPDLCAWNGERYIVCDVAVVSDNMDLDKVHQFKTNKYNITDVHRWMRQNNPIQNSGQIQAISTAFIINWRGAVSLETWSSWKKIGLSKRFLMWSSLRTLMETHKIWKIFRMNAWRERRKRRPRRIFM